MQKRLGALLLLLFAFPARAEDIDLSADNGLEWNQKESKITMMSNATAKTKDYTLSADSIEALYRGDKKIYRISAIGSVKVVSKTETIFTDELSYDLDNEIINLKSRDGVTDMRTGDSEIVSRDEVFYYKRKNYATAKAAEIRHSGRKLFADDIRIDFSPKTNDVKEVKADGNIRLVDGEEELIGNRAHYSPKDGTAVIDGSVQLKKGENARLAGGKIVYDMKTGIARILPADGGKVVGTFSTDKKTAP